MSLITCEECKREISDRAASCPHCGLPRSADQEPVTPAARPDEAQTRDVIDLGVRGGKDSYVAQEIVALTRTSWKTWLKAVLSLAIAVIAVTVIAVCTEEVSDDAGLTAAFLAVPIALCLLIAMWRHWVSIVTTGGKRWYSWNAIAFKRAIVACDDVFDEPHLLAERSTLFRDHTIYVLPGRTASYQRMNQGVVGVVVAALGALFLLLAVVAGASGGDMEVVFLGAIGLVGAGMGVLLWKFAATKIVITGIGGQHIGLIMSRHDADKFVAEFEEKLNS